MQHPPGGPYAPPPHPPGPFPGPPQGFHAAPQGPAPKKSGVSCLVIALIAGAVAIPVLGVMAALAIYGVRRYLAASKSSEAKNTVAAIGRGAVTAYERRSGEGLTGEDALCDSASPVPATVPAGRRFMASDDYETPSPDAGWRCLRFALSSPQYYQYGYTRGGPYLGPSQHGAEGFEAWARGDLDGDSAYSLFASGGRVESGRVRRDTQLFIEDEFE